MAKGLLARKLGMTQLFSEDGKVIPVTLLRAGPCTVTAIRKKEEINYNAIQLGFEPIRPKLLNKAQLGHFTGKGLEPFRYLREIRETAMDDIEIGQVLRVDIFSKGEMIKVTGISKGKGFQGVIKRYGYHGGRATHGSNFHRGPGSLGASATPSRVFKGKKMPGHKGSKNITVTNLKIIDVDTENNLLIVKGGVPGPRYALLKVEAMSK